MENVNKISNADANIITWGIMQFCGGITDFTQNILLVRFSLLLVLRVPYEAT